MGELMEIIFEEVPIHKLDECVMQLTGSEENIVSYNYSPNWDDSVKINFKDKNAIKNFFSEEDSEEIFIDTDKIMFKEVAILNCMIIILAEIDDYFLMEINFKTEDVPSMKKEEIIDNLMCFSRDFAKKYAIQNYYGGLDPAVDEDNRIFTKEKATYWWPVESIRKDCSANTTLSQKLIKGFTHFFNYFKRFKP